MRVTQKPESERDVQAAILRRFATCAWLRLWRINVGTYLSQDGRRLVATAPVGFPDLSGILPRGRAFFIETKSQRGRTSPEQMAFLKMANARGALSCVARSVEDVEQVLRIEGYGGYLDAARA